MSDTSDLVKPPARRRKKNSERRVYDLDSLLDASVDVFIAKGFEGASMEDLSTHLGITKSAIYHHVTSKNELLRLGLERALSSLELVVADNGRLDLDPTGRLEHLLRASVEVLVTERRFVTLLLRVRGNTPVEREALDRRRSVDAYVASLVTEVVGGGHAPPDLDPRVTARMIFGLVNSLAEWVRPTMDIPTLADTLCHLVFHGLLGSHASHPGEDVGHVHQAKDPVR